MKFVTHFFFFLLVPFSFSWKCGEFTPLEVFNSPTTVQVQAFFTAPFAADTQTTVLFGCKPTKGFSQSNPNDYISYEYLSQSPSLTSSKAFINSKLSDSMEFTYLFPNQSLPQLSLTVIKFGSNLQILENFTIEYNSTNPNQVISIMVMKSRLLGFLSSIIPSSSKSHDLRKLLGENTIIMTFSYEDPILKNHFTRMISYVGNESITTDFSYTTTQFASRDYITVIEITNSLGDKTNITLFYDSQFTTLTKTCSTELLECESYSYDSKNHLVSTTRFLGQTFEYSGGNLVVGKFGGLSGNVPIQFTY